MTTRLGLRVLSATDGSLAPKPQPIELSACTDGKTVVGDSGAACDARAFEAEMPSGFPRFPAALAGATFGAPLCAFGVDGSGGSRTPCAGRLVAGTGVLTAAGTPA